MKHLSFWCKFAYFMLSVFQIFSGLYPQPSVVNIFGNFLHDTDQRFRIFYLGGALFGRFLYVEMIRFLMVKILSCRLYIGVHVCYMIISIKGGNWDLFTEVSTWLEDTMHGGYFYPTWLAVWPTDWSSITICDVKFWYSYLYFVFFFW
jgi:hypothetical protein